MLNSLYRHPFISDHSTPRGSLNILELGRQNGLMRQVYPLEEDSRVLI